MMEDYKQTQKRGAKRMIGILFIVHFLGQWVISDFETAINWSIIAGAFMIVAFAFMWFLANSDKITYKLGKFALLSKQ